MGELIGGQYLRKLPEPLNGNIPLAIGRHVRTYEMWYTTPVIPLRSCSRDMLKRQKCQSNQVDIFSGPCQLILVVAPQAHHDDGPLIIIFLLRLSTFTRSFVLAAHVLTLTGEGDRATVDICEETCDICDICDISIYVIYVKRPAFN